MNFNKVIPLNCSVTSSGLMALRQPALSHPFTELSLGVGSPDRFGDLLCRNSLTSFATVTSAYAAPYARMGTHRSCAPPPAAVSGGALAASALHPASSAKTTCQRQSRHAWQY